MLDALNYSLIESNQLLTFGKSVTSLFDGFDAAADTYALAPFVSRAANAYNGYSKAYERELRNPFTGEIAQGDAVRDSALLGFRSFVVANIHSNVAAESAAAERIVSVITKHGWRAAHFGYKAETAAITKIINEINSLHMADIKLLGAEKWFNRLADSQAAFEAIQKRSDTREPSGLPTLSDTRPQLVTALRRLLWMIDNHYTENATDSRLAGYVSALNEIIGNTMSLARANQTRDENKKNTPPTPAV